MAALGLDKYLRLLRAAKPTVHPFVNSTGGQEMGAAYVVMVRAIADFVDVVRVQHPRGYPVALDHLQRILNLFPVPPVAGASDLVDLAQMTETDEPTYPAKPKEAP
jgi:hypothetical protein